MPPYASPRCMLQDADGVECGTNIHSIHLQDTRTESTHGQFWGRGSQFEPIAPRAPTLRLRRYLWVFGVFDVSLAETILVFRYGDR